MAETKSQLKIAHWSMYNSSGMNRVAESMVEAEKKLGLDSYLCNCQEDIEKFKHVYNADIHVNHTHFPDGMRQRVTKPLKIVWVGHGTPEHVFQSAVESGQMGYGHGDSWMLIQYWLQHADAIVTFWPRHEAIWRSLCDKGRKIHCIPLGVDRDFWKPTPTRGKWAGNPSLWSGENAHYIKWPLDLFILWPWVYPKVPGSCLHVSYLPKDMHRWFFPLVNRNGAAYASHITATVWDHDNLRNIFNSVDYFIGLVRYGDFNRLCLEAKACGAKTISYPGNVYSDFWLPEGDQRIMADQLVEILKGNVAPRKTEEAPTSEDMAKAMLQVYQELL